MRTALVVVAARAEVRLLDSVLPFSALTGHFGPPSGFLKAVVGADSGARTGAD